MPALLCGKRVVISTATKALQDQLYLRDLPRLVQALGMPLRIARLKGRSSYLCLHRMGQVHQSKVPLDPRCCAPLPVCSNGRMAHAREIWRSCRGWQKTLP